MAQFCEYCIGKPTDANHGGIIMYTESAKLFDVAENYGIPDIVRVRSRLFNGEGRSWTTSSAIRQPRVPLTSSTR